MPIKTIQWVNHSVKIIDQRALPGAVKFIVCKDVNTLWKAIKTLAVRGAPALGVAAAFGVLLGMDDFNGTSRPLFDVYLERLCRYIGSSRPTAVNVFNALDRMKNVARKNPTVSIGTLKKLLKKEARAICEEDRFICRRMARFGAPLIKNGMAVLTVCNAGALATVDYGTALGVLYWASEHGKKFKVYACETRPLLQGARLTAWELMRAKIDTTLICDNMAATVMRQNRVDMIITGADRIALNGDAANKIGTYNLAVLARYHKIPFYIVAPLSTFDANIENGTHIPIEERDGDEVRTIAGKAVAPRAVKVYNPAFDITDHTLITALITECGIVRPPFKPVLTQLLHAYASHQ